MIAAQAKPDVSTATAMAETGKNITDATVKAAARKRAADSSINEDRVNYYFVKAGDTLWSIAQKYRISLKQIRQWNNLKSNNLSIGTKLVVKKA